MHLILTERERSALEAAATTETNVRRWRRDQAVLLVAAGHAPAAIAPTLRCRRASVYAWTARWRQGGVPGLREGDHGGGQLKLDRAGEAVWTDLLASDPRQRGSQATGWTVPLLRRELEQAGYVVSAHTVRRALHRLGSRWEAAALRAGPPRSGRRRNNGAVIAAVQAMLAADGEVWVADETALCEVPPLRAGWSRRGTPAHVRSSGKNTRRTILGALNAATGELVCTVRERCRTDDVLAAVQALGAVRPAVPTLLIWDNAPPHHPHRVRDLAQEAGITLALLPLRSPELLPLEELWRGLTAVVAANRGYPSLAELTDRAVDWLDTMDDEERRRRCALHSSKFHWLPT